MAITAPGLIKWNASELPAFPGYPHSEVSLTTQINVSVFTSGSGLEQRVAMDQWIPRAWILTIPAMDLSKRDIMEAFWRDRSGKLKPFKWTSPATGELYYVRFEQNSFGPQQIGPKIWTWTAQIREIHPSEINLEG